MPFLVHKFNLLKVNLLLLLKIKLHKEFLFRQPSNNNSLQLKGHHFKETFNLGHRNSYNKGKLYSHKEDPLQFNNNKDPLKLCQEGMRLERIKKRMKMQNMTNMAKLYIIANSKIKITIKLLKMQKKITMDIFMITMHNFQIIMLLLIMGSKLFKLLRLELGKLENWDGLKS